MEIVRKHMKITGEVQGVGFRYRSQHSANYIGLKGWVRNDYDGSVEMEVQGTEEQIKRLFEMIRQSSHIEIHGIEEEKIPLVDNEIGFSIRY